MNIAILLDRFETLYPNNTALSDLRRAYIDKDVSSIVRIIDNNNKENLLRFVMDDHIWGAWPVLDQYAQTQFVKAFKDFYVNDIEIADDCFARGQLLSKSWIIQELSKLDLNFGTIFLCAGWYGTLATMLFENDFKINKIRSFDIDESCWKIAETFNKPWVMKDWKFKSSTQDINEINYDTHVYHVKRSNGTDCELTDSPDTVINTSCEHIENFNKWYDKIPKGKILILQTNNYFDLPEHVNCSKTLEDFSKQTPMTKTLYQGELFLEKYSRYMRIGIK